MRPVDSRPSDQSTDPSDKFEHTNLATVSNNDGAETSEGRSSDRTPSVPPPLRADWIAFRTIVTKEYLRFVRIWVQTVLPPMVTTSLYFIIFGGLIGSRIGDMDGLRYIDFIVPGLILLAVITNSYSNVVSSFFSAKFQRHIEEILVSPTSSHAVVLGFIGGGVARGLLVGGGVFAIALLFAEPRIEHPALAVLLLLLTSTLFSIAGLINGVFARTFDDISIVPTFVLTPLTYLSGVFYTIQLLPPFWQTVSLVNPILYMVDGFRFSLYGQSDIHIASSLGVLILFNTLAYLLAWQLIERGIGTRK